MECYYLFREDKLVYRGTPRERNANVGQAYEHGEPGDVLIFHRHGEEKLSGWDWLRKDYSHDDSCWRIIDELDEARYRVLILLQS